VLPERDVVLEEVNIEGANQSGCALTEQIMAALYSTILRRPVTGWRHVDRKLDRDDALAFYRRSTRRTTRSW